MAISRSTKTKLATVVIATVLFTVVTAMLASLVDLPLGQTITGALLLGLIAGLIEEFYFMSPRGRWLRAMHPLAGIVVYAAILVTVVMIVMHVDHAVWGRWSELPAAYARLPVALPIVLCLVVAVITFIRIIGFLGARNVAYLIVGKYHRPVMEKKVFLFLDIEESTWLVEKLGPIETRALIGKFFFDISTPIADQGGEIYRFTGDGVVVTWDWDDALDGDAVFNAIDGIRETVSKDTHQYVKRFGVVPRYRIGIHGGDIVVSEEGDIKRAIGFYGDTIHIAARMEQKAKELGVDVLISETVARSLMKCDQRLKLLETEVVRVISQPMGMYTLADPQRGQTRSSVRESGI